MLYLTKLNFFQAKLGISCNQEDGIILNKSSVERGMFGSTSYDTITVKESKPLAHSYETIGLPPLEKRQRQYNYSLLDENGIVRTRINGNSVYVKKDDVIVAKTLCKTNKSSEEEIEDHSYAIKHNEEGYIDRVMVMTRPSGYKIIKVVIRQTRIPEIADKFAMRAAQKGTVGMILRQEDMPFTMEGITPDLIMNPHAISSRMTCNILMEAVLGKSCLIDGKGADATPFTKSSIGVIDDICNRLASVGFEATGTEELYNGMTGEVIPARIFIGPMYCLRLKHMVSDKIHCLDIEKTEVLTKQGWKQAYDLTLDDEIATLKDEILVYEKPKNIFLYPDYEGDTYNISNQAIDYCVTMNHRMWVSSSGKDNTYDFKFAENIVGKEIRYKKDAKWIKTDYQFALPSTIKHFTPTVDFVEKEKLVDMDAWLTFFGIWYAEGWATGKSNSGRVTIAANKQRVRDSLFPAFDKLGYQYHYNEKTKKVTVYNVQLYRYMKPLSVGAKKKKLPEWVFELSESQTRLLINSLCLGDGSYSKRTGCKWYCTTSVSLAGQFQQLVLHAGWAGNISVSVSKDRPACFINGRSVISQADVLRISINTKRTRPTVNHYHVKEQKVQKETVEFKKCPMFCLEVSSGVFYVRRNGKGSWTGNSRAQGQVTALFRQPLEGRSRSGGLRYNYALVVLIRYC